MGDDASRRGSERRPVGLQVRLAYGDLGEFVERYATNISAGGIFIRSRDRRPVGTRLSFELRLRTGEVVFAGEGTVRWVLGVDARGLGIPGMGLQFDHLTDETRTVLERILAAREHADAPPPVEGARPSSWRPLDEFPPPPPDPMVELEEENAPPPVLAPVRAPGVAAPPPAGAGLPTAISRMLVPTQKAVVVAPPVIAAPALTSMLLAPAPLPTAPEAVERTTPRFGQPSGSRSVVGAFGVPVAVDGGPASVPPPAAYPAFSGRVGLDFGWSLVRVAVVREGVPHLLTLGGAGGVPPMVAEGEGGPIVGEAARKALEKGVPGARGVFRLLGRWLESPALGAWQRRNLVGLEGDAQGRPGLRFGGEVRTALALATQVLSAVKRAIEAEVGGPVTSAVVSVPLALGDLSRRMLREAASAAGIEIERFVSAAAAAVLAVHGPRGKRRLLVVDYGEGSFEAAVVEQANHVVEVVASASALDLGGADLDLSLVESLLTQFEKETGFVVPEERGLFERVREAATRAKEALTDSLETEVIVPDLMPAGLSRAELRLRVPRARLHALASSAVDRAFEVTRSALAARGFGGSDLDGILLLGGQTRMSMLSRRLAEKLGREPERPAIAREAAVFGAALVAQRGLEVSPFVVAGAVGATVGAALPGGHLKRILERNQALPCERVYTAVTAVDQQAELELHLFQGEKPQAFDNDYLGTLRAGPLPRRPRGEMRLTFTIAMSEDGELSASARDLGSGREVPVRFDRSGTPAAVRRSLENS